MSEKAKEAVRQYLAGMAEYMGATEPGFVAWVFANNGTNLDALVNAALNDSCAWDACAMIARECFSAGSPVPTPLADLLLGAMVGTHTRPKTAKRHRMFLRNYVIRHAIKRATEHGVTETRNDEASSTTSACDIVSEALREHGIHVSYQGIKEIWKRRDKDYFD